MKRVWSLGIGDDGVPCPMRCCSLPAQGPKSVVRSVLRSSHRHTRKGYACRQEVRSDSPCVHRKRCLHPNIGVGNTNLYDYTASY